MMETYAYIQQGLKDATRVREILRLPDDAWSDIKIRFGLDEHGTAEVTFLLTGEQLIALAEVAFKRNTSNDCADDDAGYAHSDPINGEQLSLLGEEQ